MSGYLPSFATIDKAAELIGLASKGYSLAKKTGLTRLRAKVGWLGGTGGTPYPSLYFKTQTRNRPYRRTYGRYQRYTTRYRRFQRRTPRYTRKPRYRYQKSYKHYRKRYSYSQKFISSYSRYKRKHDWRSRRYQRYS